MAGTKSPKYPNFSLRTALNQAEKIFKADRRNTIAREVAVKHMGYGGLSGASEKALGTLVQYGLTQNKGKGEIAITQLTVDILHPDGPQQRRESLARAAFSPPLFKALKDRFPDGVSDEALRSYLVRESFLDRAISPVISAFNETCAFLKQEGAFESDGEAESAGPNSDLSSGWEGDEPSTAHGGARVGDFIQWETPAGLQLEQPTRVRWVSDDEQWVAVDGSDTGIPMAEVLVHERAGAVPPVVPPAPLTKAQEMACSPGVGPVSAARLANLPPLGWAQAIFPLADGPVFLNFPDQMTADGYAELKEYLSIFLRRAERAKRQQEGPGGEGSETQSSS
ncbi:MAG: hypothetical protein ACREEW_02030 [Caulobacteraceae bacterium]